MASFRPNRSSSLQTSSRKPAQVKGNTSILSFFKKADGPPKSNQNRITQYVVRRESSGTGRGTNTGDGEGNGRESLFFEERVTAESRAVVAGPESTRRSPSPGLTLDGFGGRSPVPGAGDERYNEWGGSMKRRKVGSPPSRSELPLQDTTRDPESTHSGFEAIRGAAASIRRRGPFIDESDSEDGDGSAISRAAPTSISQSDGNTFSTAKIAGSAVGPPAKPDDSTYSTPLSHSPTPADSDDEGGTPKQTWDVGDDNNFGDDSCADFPFDNGDWEASPFAENEVPVCPICRTTLSGMTDMEASLHVNNCLDGSPDSPPKISKKPAPDKEPTRVVLTREERKLMPRPAQRNPFELGSKPSASSAFSKLMAAKVEASAWETAAASEESSRGRQAYQRTCPFYKILPGFSICVDAFRYGAVEGCSAYFLSHFHSDHYIGLTGKWCHGKIYCSRVTGNLVRQQLRVDPSMVVDLDWETKFEVPDTDGVQVTMIPANHCPGSSLFLFEKTVGKGKSPKVQRILHCGDFRACPSHVQHPLLRPNVLNPVTSVSKEQVIDVCYLDTTYLNPKYAFPNQEDVTAACSQKCLLLNGSSNVDLASQSKPGRVMSKFLSEGNRASDNGHQPKSEKGRLLVVIGTYSIGKERLCLAIARALKCKIYAPAAKQRICACLEDEELSSFLTTNPRDAQVHMQSLMEIRPDTLLEYLNTLKPHFQRIVAFRPTGWNYRPPAGRMTDNPSVDAILHSESWKASFSIDDLVPQRGSNSESMCFSVPYSEHSSFRELTMFCCALRISRIIPTVNVGSAKTREKMKRWVEKWEAEKRKSGLFKVEDGAVRW